MDVKVLVLILSSIYVVAASGGLLSVKGNPVATSMWTQENQEKGRPIARKFDEFSIGDDLTFGDMKVRLDRFYTDGLLKEPTSRAYAIFYRGRRRTSSYDHLQVKTYLVARGFPVNNFKAIYGGYRERPMLELWVVPDGAANPDPTPTAHLKKRQKR